MIIGYDYPILGAFWSLMFLFLWVVWIVLIVRVIADIFRNHKMGGVAKALWLLFVVFVPILGALFYLFTQGDSMEERDIHAAHVKRDAANAQIRAAAATASAADELAELVALKDQGVLTEAEFAAQKAKILV